MSQGLKSTTAKVKNAKKLKKVLSKYELRGIAFQVDEERNLEAVNDPNDSPEVPHWPEAVLEDQLPPYPDDENDEDALEAYEEVFDEKGGEGLIALLREIATCLETPLLIVALNRNAFEEPVAQVWNLQPGVAEVQTLEVIALHPNQSGD
jgi:hypothetical protein